MGLELVESEPLNLPKNKHPRPPSCAADMLRLRTAVCKLQVRSCQDSGGRLPVKNFRHPIIRSTDKFSLFLILG